MADDFCPWCLGDMACSLPRLHEGHVGGERCLFTRPIGATQAANAKEKTFTMTVKIADLPEVTAFIDEAVAENTRLHGLLEGAVAEDARLRARLAEYDARRRGRCDWCGSSGQHEDSCTVFTPAGAVR